MLKETLDDREDLQKHLFTKGFLITENDEINIGTEFPFYDNWDKTKVGKYNFIKHKNQNCFFNKIADVNFFLVGHAYNPFTMEYEEDIILEKISESFLKNKDAYLDAIDELTGLFILGYIKDNQINFVIDPSGFQTAFFGQINKEFFLASHFQLIDDLCDLKKEKIVKELIEYKWYTRIQGPYLPADLSPYENIKRAIPNIYYSYKNNEYKIERFYPRKEIKVCETEEEYLDVIKSAAEILKNNMKLIVEKWNKPQISLTGGIDSNTIFAAASSSLEKYETFSYVSAEKEKKDADAAEKIARKFNVKHTTYDIPGNVNELKDYKEIVEIINHNNGNIKYVNENELRKRVSLINNCTAGVEVKSWASETIRGGMHSRYGRKSMPKLSAKLYRNLYKMFIFNRRLAYKIDDIYEDYIEKYMYEQISKEISASDIFMWENIWGSWGGSNISEMRICFDITIPYNNRVFLNLMFKVPLDKRISDDHHMKMKKYLNEELYDMNIKVNNLHHTDFRAKMLNVIFTINQLSPF